MSANRGCAAHRQELLALLDDPMGQHLAPAARAHLAACADCRSDMQGLVLAARTVRRVLATGEELEPAADAWPRLRARIGRRPPRIGRAASPVLGLALGASLAAALLLPLGAMKFRAPAAAPTPAVLEEAGLDPAAILAAGRRDAEAEARSLRATALAGKEVSSDEANTRAREALIRVETSFEPDHRPAQPRGTAVSVE